MKLEDLPEDVRQIVEDVAEETGLRPEEIMDRSTGRRANAYARFEAMARIREVFDEPEVQVRKLPPQNRYTLVQTGQFFDADHTSVIHAIKRRTEAAVELKAALAMMNTPREVHLADRRLKSAVARLKMAQRRRALEAANCRRQGVKMPPRMKTRDDKHVEAVLAAGGFCHYSEVQLGTAPGGGRLMQITLPMVWPVADQMVA